MHPNPTLREHVRAKAESERLLRLYMSAYAHYLKEPAMAQAMATDPIGPAPEGVEFAELAALAIAKMEGLDGDPSKLAADSIKSGFGGTRVKGRVLDVLINTSEPKHVVAYVRFRGTKAADVIKDASAIAHVVSKQAPLVSTLSLSAIHPKAPATSKKSVWSAKIAADRMGNINPKRIEDYADRMYKRLFEVVDSVPF